MRIVCSRVVGSPLEALCRDGSREHPRSMQGKEALECFTREDLYGRRG